MSRSPTITNSELVGDPEDWLHNPHAGEMLALEFLEPIDMRAGQLAELIDLPERRIVDVIEGNAPMDAELDLRLSRYFGMSDGFFLRLQVAYEILQKRRAIGRQVDRIVPRAA